MANPAVGQSLLGDTVSYLSAGKTFDSSGNLYTVYQEVSNTTKEVVIMKMRTATGDVVWTATAPITGSATDERFDPAIAVDVVGTTYVAYTTSGTAETTVKTGGLDIIVAKYSNTGVQQWITPKTTDVSFNTVQDDLNPALVYDPVNAALYLSYETTGTPTGLTNAGSKDIVVSRFNTSGILQWTRILGTTQEDCASSLSTDTQGNLILAFSTRGAFVETTLTGSTYDVVIAKYSAAGTLLWRKQSSSFNTTGSNMAPAVATDANNNIFCVYTRTGGTSNSMDLVLFKLTRAGEFLWVKQDSVFNTAAADSESSIAVDQYGYVYISYTSRGAITGNTNAGETDIVVVKMNGGTGAQVWAKQNPLFNTSRSEYSPTVCVATADSMTVMIGHLMDGLSETGVTESGYTDVGVMRVLQTTPLTTNVLTAAPPTAPTALTNSSVNNQLSWTAPVGTITGYRVYTQVGFAKTLVATITDGTTAVAHSVLPKGTSTFVVTAYTTNGESEESDPLTLTLVDRPEKPTVSVTDSTATLTFTTVANATSYTLLTSADATVQTGITSSPVTLSNLDPGQYTYVLRANNSAGSSVASESVTATVLATPTLTTTVTEKSVSIAFTTVSNATSYRLLDADGTVLETRTSSPFTSLIRDPGSYSFTVRAFATDTTSPNATTTATVFAAPASISGTVSGTTITVAFAEVSGATSYELLNEKDEYIAANATSPFTLTSQAAGTYLYKVRALTGIPTSTITKTVLAAPTSLSVNVTENTATIKSDRVNNATSYYLYTNGIFDVSGAEPTFTRSALSSGTYNFNIAGVNGSEVGQTAASPVSAKVLGAPAGGQITTSGSSITITCTRDPEATSYILYRGDDSLIDDKPTFINGQTPSFTRLDRTPGEYTYLLRAVTTGTLGPASTMLTAIVLSAPANPSIGAAANTVTVTTNTVRDATSYKIYTTDDVELQTSETPSFTLNFQAIGTHSYKVRAANSTGVGSVTTTPSVIVLAAPTAPMITAVQSTITIPIPAVENATGYKLYDANDKFLQDITTSGSITVTRRAGTWSFGLRAVTATSESALVTTNAVTVVAPTPPTAVTADGTASEITWSAPTDSLSTITSYRMYTIAGVDSVYTFFRDISANVTAVPYSTLMPNVKPVTYVMTSVSETGESAYSTTTATVEVSFETALAGSVPLGAFVGTVLNDSEVTATQIKDVLRTNQDKFSSSFVNVPNANVSKLIDTSSLPEGKTAEDLAALPVSVMVFENGGSVTLDPAAVPMNSVLYIPSNPEESVTVVFGDVSYNLSFTADSKMVINGTSYSPGDSFMLGSNSFYYAATGSQAIQNNGSSVQNIVTDVSENIIFISFTSLQDNSIDKYEVVNITTQEKKYTIESSPFPETISVSFTEAAGVYTYVIIPYTGETPSNVIPTEFTVTVLAQPLITTSTVNGTTVTVLFNAVTDASGYTLYDTTNAALQTVSAPTTQFVLTDVTSSNEYYMRAFYVPPGGTAEYSAVSNIEPVTVLSTAGPTNVTANVSDTTVTITFDIVSGADSYTLYSANTIVNSSTYTLTTSSATSPTRITLTLLNQPTGTYSYEISASTESGSETQRSSPVTAIVLAAPSLTKTSVTGTTVTLNLGSVTNATSYTIYDDGVSIRTGISAGTVILSNQSVGSHTYQARGITTNTVGQASASVSVTVLAAPSFTTASVNGTTLSVTLGGVTGASSYTLIVGGLEPITQSNSLSYTVSSLTAGTYLLSAYANTSDGGTGIVATQTVYVLSKPVITASHLGTMVTVTVSPAVTNASRYVLYDAAPNTVDVSGTSTTLVTTEAGAGTYNYYVRATRTNATSLASDTASVTILAAPDVTIVVTNNSVAVTCNDVVGSTAYRLYSSATSSSALAESVTPSFTRILSNGTYTYYVRAVSATGAGQVSGGTMFIVNYTVPTPPPTPPTGDSVPCFLASAPVLTPTGYRRIGRLRDGDLVMTAAGDTVPITRVKVYQVESGPATNPYRIAVGQFGATKSFLISPNHKVAVDGAMIEARELGLRREHMEGTITYYNLELPEWSNMIVGGVEVESLAPVRRVRMALPIFAALLRKKHGTTLTDALMDRILKTCRLYSDGTVEAPVMRNS
jgi:hypothetical protein